MSFTRLAMELWERAALVARLPGDEGGWGGGGVQLCTGGIIYDRRLVITLDHEPQWRLRGGGLLCPWIRQTPAVGEGHPGSSGQHRRPQTHGRSRPLGPVETGLVYLDRVSYTTDWPCILGPCKQTTWTVSLILQTGLVYLDRVQTNSYTTNTWTVSLILQTGLVYLDRVQTNSYTTNTWTVSLILQTGLVYLDRVSL